MYQQLLLLDYIFCQSLDSLPTVKTKTLPSTCFEDAKLIFGKFENEESRDRSKKKTYSIKEISTKTLEHYYLELKTAGGYMIPLGGLQLGRRGEV